MCCLATTNYSCESTQQHKRNMNVDYILCLYFMYTYLLCIVYTSMYVWRLFVWTTKCCRQQHTHTISHVSHTKRKHVIFFDAFDQPLGPPLPLRLCVAVRGDGNTMLCLLYASSATVVACFMYRESCLGRKRKGTHSNRDWFTNRANEDFIPYRYKKKAFL